MKSAIFLLALCCISFALIDPPVQEVDQHNRGIAPQGILHQNFLNYSEKDATLNDPTIFFYVKILTLTPSVNASITSKLHPALIWMATEKHNSTVREGYDNGYCDKRVVTRDFDEMKVKDVTAYYTLDGLRQQMGNETVYNTANAAVVLATGPVTVNLPNGSISVTDATFNNPSEVPFKHGTLAQEVSCALIALINSPVSYLLGGMINLSCYEESLAYASPYGTGVYNLTVRNLTIVNPHLNVTLHGTFTIDYTEHGTEEHKEGTECKSDSWDSNGTITLVSSDFASYEVQNDYMTLLPYLPGVFSLSGNTSEDVMYHATLLSNSNLYKYYSNMDNQTAGAYYVYAFNVTQDGYGTRFIIANVTDHAGLLPEDPECQNNYTGPHRILNVMWGNSLRSPTEMNNLAYNYSRIYDLEEVFYNVSNGEHHARLEFYTWFGNYSAPSDINVSSLTSMTLYAYPAGGSLVAVCTLTSRGQPVAAQTVELHAGNRTMAAVTNNLGVCTGTFDSGGGATTGFADFRGTSTLLPSSADYAVFSLMAPTATTANFSIANFGLLLVLSALFAFSFLSMARSFSPFGGGAKIGDAAKKFYPFAPKGVPKGKPTVRVKKGKELATSVAIAAATGGAGGAVAGKAAEEAAKKKLGSEAAKKKLADETGKKALENRAKRELSEKVEKKVLKKTTTKKETVGAAPKKPDDDKNKKWLNSQVWDRCSDKTRILSDKDLHELTGFNRAIQSEQLNWLKEKFPDRFGNERFKQLDCYVTRDSQSFATRFYAKYPDIVDGQAKAVVTAKLENLAPKGIYDPNSGAYGANMEAIQQAHGYDKNSVRSCFIGTAAHEQLHRQGDFQDTFSNKGLMQDKDLIWAYEGTTEDLARQFMRERFSDQFKTFDCTTYDSLINISKEFQGLAGEKNFHEAYFDKDFQRVYDRLIIDMKATPTEVEHLLDILGKCNGDTTTSDKEYKDAIRAIRDLKTNLQKRANNAGMVEE